MCTSNHHIKQITFIRITVNSDSFLMFKTAIVAMTKRQQMVNDLKKKQKNFQLRKRMQEIQARSVDQETTSVRRYSDVMCLLGCQFVSFSSYVQVTYIMLLKYDRNMHNLFMLIARISSDRKYFKPYLFFIPQ